NSFEMNVTGTVASGRPRVTWPGSRVHRVTAAQPLPPAAQTPVGGRVTTVGAESASPIPSAPAPCGRPYSIAMTVDGPDAILVAVDASETSFRAGASAAGLARRQGSRLICLYVRSRGGLTGLSPALAGPVNEAQEQTADEIRQAIASNAGRLGI